MASFTDNNSTKGGQCTEPTISVETEEKTYHETPSAQISQNKDIIMTIKEVHEATGLSVYSIRAGIRDGVLPAFRINGSGGKYFVNYEQFQAAIRNLCNQNVQRKNEHANVVSITGIRRIKE